MSGARAALRDGIRLALGTLTVLPVPPPRTVDRASASVAMTLAPLAALPLAAVAALAVLAGTWWELPALVTAVAAVGVSTLGSRGLHLDGLADTADGLSASYSRERALEVMRRGDVGPSGVVALLLVLLAQVGALAGLIATGMGVAGVVLSVLAGRSVLPLCCVRGVPSARPDGLGAAVAGTVRPVAAGAVLVTTAALAAGLSALQPGLPWWQGVLGVSLGWVVSAALLARAVRRFGGVTGDVLGAGVEIATLAVLVTLSAA